ncbi:uncharacterized protein LOC144594697 [Rhinoraja longicauda]
MQNTNVVKIDMADKRRGPSKAKNIGEVILPGGPKGQLSKLSQLKLKDNEKGKRTSVAVLKYNPGLAKTRQADKRNRSLKKGSGNEVEEDQLWSTIPGGTEVHFSGHAIRHLKPSSESSPGKTSAERKSSVDYPMKQINQEILKTLPQRKPPQKQSSPDPWMEPRKARQIVVDIYIWEPEALNHLLFNAIDTDEGVYSLLQEVNDQLLNFDDIERLLS